MTTKLIALAALTVFAAAPALAETPAVAPIDTQKEAKALIGAPLDTSASGGSVEAQAETLFYLDGNNVKPSGEWTDADRKACTAAGGVDLPISAGRIACIRL